MLTAERLRELLHYEHVTGVFTWLVRAGQRVRVGDIAGRINKGYRQITIGRRLYPAHRLAWLYMTGKWPHDQLDHVNLVKDDNRWSNLREATRVQNEGNKRVQFNNTSGFKGVSWDTAARKWRAQIMVNGKQIHLGCFDAAKPHLAYAAVCLASRKHFGEFARVYEADQLIIPAKVFEERVLRNLLKATQCQFEEAA